MQVIEQFLAPAAEPPEAWRVTLDRHAATRFLRCQGSWLQEGLQRACDPHEVARVLSAHDACHDAWLALIAAVHGALGDAPADTVTALYAFQGRVAGNLERGPEPLLSGAVRAELRMLLETRLAKLTDAAIAAVCCPAAP